ncbi:MAG: thymidylate synthase [Balneolales bacterium]
MGLLITGHTASEIWTNIALKLNNGNAKAQPSRAGNTSEYLKVLLELNNPRERWVLTREPGINPAFAIAEVVWIMNGRNDSKFLNFWNNQLPKFAGTTNEYHGAYGFRLRNQFDIDQLNNAYQTFLNNPESRQVVLQIWQSNIDSPKSDGSPASKDVPCNIVSMLKVRDGKLEWTQIMRSNDLMRGLPHNLIQFTMLQEIMAGWLGMDVGSYHHFSDSMHLYHDSKEDFSIVSREEIINIDDLRVKKESSEILFKEFSDKIENLIFGNVNAKTIREISSWTQAPKAYQNLLFIICAEAARRFKYNSLVTEFIEKCDNPILNQAWFNWCQRFNQPQPIK